LALAFLAGSPNPSPTQETDYGKQVKPFLARYCLECHNSTSAKSDLNLETPQGIRHGGKRGPVLVPSKPDESRLVLLAEGKIKPAMPPKKAKQPNPKEVAVLREWVAAGARDDSVESGVRLPDIRPRTPRAAPVVALSYRPDGKILAAARYKAVVLVDSSSGEVVWELKDLPAKVSALALSPDGSSLAVALSTPGSAGQLQIHKIGANSITPTPDKILSGHKDAILAVAYSPNGKTVASAGYDRLIKLWDVSTGKEFLTLKDHSDAIYGLAFSPDGSLLASGAADRAVKVWDAATGKRLLTLAESTDWVYAVAWSPNGRHLAAAGVDKSIRVWEVTRHAGKIVRSVFGHEGPVTRLIYSPDGATIFSLGEDRVVKSWNSATMLEKHVYDRQSDAVLAMALRADQKQVAVGRYDGALRLLDATTGKVQFEPLPEKPKPPQLSMLSPDHCQRGKAIRLKLEGKHLASVTEMTTSIPAATAKILNKLENGDSIQADLVVPSNTPAGVYNISLKAAGGNSAHLPFIVDLYPLVESARESVSDQALTLKLPASVAGVLSRAGRVDYYQFEARAGQEIGAQLVSAFPESKLEPVIQLAFGGSVVAEGKDGLLGHVCSQTGTYFLSVRDRDYRGGPEMRYRLHVGDIPIAMRVFPLGLQRGTEAEVHVEGVNLGPLAPVRVKAPAEAKPGSRLPVSVNTPNGKPPGNLSVIVGEFPEVARRPSGEPPLSVQVPGTVNGRIEAPQQTDVWRFLARKGERLVLEVNAHRIGSPLDSYIEILDAHGAPVPRAVLRSVAKTYVTFRDHDSVSSGIRLENWSELAMGDYLWTGNELIRIYELPKNPDDDCRFFNVKGVRLAFLDTTPLHLSQGTPLYKVTIHPPGTTFPPNGFPVITLNHRNDDGGLDYGKDSRLFFDPPADGEYRVRIGDSHGHGGPAYAYRLTIRPPRPDFTVHFSPTAPAVWRGSAVPITVNVNRIDGFDGPIQVQLENVPSGFSAPPTTISADENTTAFAFFADTLAKTPANAPPLKLIGRAMIGGKEIRHEAVGQLPKVVEPGDLVTTTDQSEVIVRPGNEVKLHAKIERKNGFKGRVPLDVRGLPRGVRVLDIGLNGILITEKDDGRTFAIYAEPWVQPQTHPFVVLAKNEGKDAEYAAKSVLLRIEPAQK
jgi:hypothetical protein